VSAAPRPTLFDRAFAERAARSLARRDPRLRGFARSYGPVRLPPRRPGGGFAFLARAVVYQQLAIPAASAIARRLEERCGGPPNPRALRRLGAEHLAACGLSRPKIRTLLALSEAELSGALRLRGLGRLGDAAVEARLVALPGIGAWTARIFTLFHLGRPDVFPEGDLALRDAMASLLGEPEAMNERGAARLAERWSPQRSTVAWWLWRARSGAPPGLRDDPQKGKPKR
jgi:DNA-3-methyladenine glycosylase II